MLPDDDPFPHVPTVKPAKWHAFRVFRETFLADVREMDSNEAFRAFGQAQGHLVGEAGGFWPFTYMDATAHGLQAVLADLRFLQGFLVDHCQRSEEDRGGDRKQYGGDEEAVKMHDALCNFGNRLAGQIELLADELEIEVIGWQFKERPYGT